MSLANLDDGVGLLARLRAGELSVPEAVAASIRRAEAMGPTLNAIVEPCFDAARAHADDEFDARRQPLAGLPFLYKDYAIREGDPAFQGNHVLAAFNHRHSYSANAVRRLDAAGVVSLGRTHAPEFAVGNCAASSETELYGHTHNPWDLTRTPMGSSGGSAAAVAAGIVPIAHASDGGGSIRMPASACGLVGLKPNRGRISMAPGGDSWGGGTTEGVLTRSVRDTALALDVLAGREAGDAVAPPRETASYLEVLKRKLLPLRIGVATDFAYTHSAPECREAVLRAGKVLESFGHQVELEHPEALDRPDYMRHYIKVIQASTAFALTELEAVIGRAWTRADMEEGSWEVYQRGLRVQGREVLAGLDSVARWSREVSQWFESGWNHDILVTPTLAGLPPKNGWLVDGDTTHRRQRLAALMPFTAQFNVTGQPAISLPLHWTAEGLPVGVQFVAAAGREDMLLQLAAQLEEAMPWRDRRPPLFAADV